MEKLNLRKNPGDILYAADVSSIVSTINNIITYITSENGSGSGSGSEGSVGDVVDIPSPIITWGNRIPTPWTEDGYNEFGLPWGIWLLSYLISDLENLIHERLLSESEYTLYLGSGWNIATDISITWRADEFRDELFNTPMLISLWPSGSTDFSKADLAGDNYKITGVPSMWEVLVNTTNIDPSNTYGVEPYYTDYRQFIEASEVIYNLNWHNTFYNKAVSMWGPEENPIVEYTGTVIMTTGDNNTNRASESINVPINPARDLSLDHLFVIIPAKTEENPNGLCTWEQFCSDPEGYVLAIKANDYHETIVAAQTQYEDDIKNVLKETIIRDGTDRFGINFDTNVPNLNYTYRSTLNNYLNRWLTFCQRIGVDMRDRAEDIVIGWFKKHAPQYVHFIMDEIDYGIVQNPGIIWSDLDGTWDSSNNRYTGKNGYRYTSVKHMRDIPRFDKLYCLDEIANGITNGGPSIYKGPLQDVSYCPRFENNVESEDNVIDGSCWANEGDIIVELIANLPENHQQILYLVMYGNTGQMRTDALFAEQMFDVSNALEYLTSSTGKDRFYNNHPNATRVAKGVTISLPYENVVDISTGSIDDTVITDKYSPKAEGKYFRYGGSYTIFAFKAIKPFCIKDTKWGRTEVNDYLWQITD